MRYSGPRRDFKKQDRQTTQTPRHANSITTISSHYTHPHQQPCRLRGLSVRKIAKYDFGILCGAIRVGETRGWPRARGLCRVPVSHNEITPVVHTARCTLTAETHNRLLDRRGGNAWVHPSLCSPTLTHLHPTPSPRHPFLRLRGPPRPRPAVPRHQLHWFR